MLLENLRLKLRYIFWPYLRVLLLTIAGAACVSALLTVALPQVEPPEWLMLWLSPAIVALALVTLVLWPHFRLLLERNGPRRRFEKGNLRDLLVITAAVTLACAWGSTSYFVQARVGSLRRLPTLASVADYPSARYYQAPDLALDSLHMGVEFQTESTGKHNDYLKLKLLIACPVGTTVAAPAWVGFAYSDQIKRSASPSIQEAAYQKLVQASKQAFHSDKIKLIRYLKRAPNNDERTELERAASRSVRYHAGAGQLLILLPERKAFAQRGEQARLL